MQHIFLPFFLKTRSSEGQALALRYRQLAALRGTGPRTTIPPTGSTARETRLPARVACEGPSPMVTQAVFFNVARGPVPRDACRQEGLLDPLGPTCL